MAVFKLPGYVSKNSPTFNAIFDILLVIQKLIHLVFSVRCGYTITRVHLLCPLLLFILICNFLYHHDCGLSIIPAEFMDKDPLLLLY